ncbi:hypothetical protein KI387_005454, partial [Taxus chinensis]
PYSEWTMQEEEIPAYTEDEISSFEREAMEGEALARLDDIFEGDVEHAIEEPPPSTT